MQRAGPGVQLWSTNCLFGAHRAVFGGVSMLCHSVPFYLFLAVFRGVSSGQRVPLKRGPPGGCLRENLHKR